MIRSEVNDLVRVGDVVRITSTLTVTEKDRISAAGKFTLAGRAHTSGSHYIWHYGAISEIEIVTRKPYPKPKRGDMWRPNDGMVPVYFCDGHFKFPTGMGKSYTESGTMSTENFFTTFPNAKLIMNTVE